MESSTRRKGAMARARARRRREEERADEPPPPAPLLEDAAALDWIDLLHQDSLPVRGVEVLRSALRFAFESGDAGGLLELVVDQAPVAASGFDPASFAEGLFLPELLGEAFPIAIGDQRFVPSLANLQRVISHPPEDARDMSLRQTVLRELVEAPALREATERVYLALRRLRTLLDERAMLPDETIRRKIEVLQTLADFLDAADALAPAKSALGRLFDLATDVRARQLDVALRRVLEFDGQLAELDLRVVVGADGKIRDVELAEARENTLNPHVRGPWARFWSRVRAWFRGYRYGDNEVLLKVIDDVFAELEDIVLPLFRIIGHLEVYLASLGFRAVAEQRGLDVCLAETEDEARSAGDEGPGAAFERLFNPLLLLQRIEPIPCDLEPKRPDALVLVTGPNSGGKTRLLQALGLAQLLGQSGLFVPARRARLVHAPSMFLSLIDGAGAAESEGRLGTELRRVRRLFEEIEPGSLVILDELCSGTNPGEGIAIFELVLELLPRLRPQVFLTTHFLDAARELEARAEGDAIERLEFLQVELDDEQPTYQFVPGVAPTSLASRVAGRLGVTREELEALVEERLR